MERYIEVEGARRGQLVLVAQVDHIIWHRNRNRYDLCISFSILYVYFSIFLNPYLNFTYIEVHGTSYFRCSQYSQTGCHAALTLSNGQYSIHRENDHNHDDVRDQLARIVFVSWCREKARTTNQSISTIYIAALQR